MPFGAEYRPGEGVRFRIWAPNANHVTVCLTGQNGELALPMGRATDGWFELITDRASRGAGYQFQIDSGLKVPDPASRFQPGDVHGPSEVIDPAEFEWTDDSWLGRPWADAVMYELHVGTFTPEGTFAGIEKRLDYLAHLGVTAIELMPLSDFPGRRNWGYDGVLPFAPDSSYGRPSDLKRLIQAAHARGLMMFLDVVYNHFGPEGNYLRSYSPQFFTGRHHTPWGEAINFDGPESRTVRDFFIQNALYWLTEYHFDGLRFDAVHAILDDSRPDILTELAQTVRAATTSNRHVHLVLENDNNAARYLAPEKKLYNAQWNDDIHHALHVSLSGESNGYYGDYVREPVRRVARCLTEGFDYQGASSPFRDGARRGEPSLHLPPTCFVSFLQNHDQVGNRAFGDRILKVADLCAVKAAMTVLLLAPSPPLLFMGEEFGAKTPFLFFCDFEGDLARAVREGRQKEFSFSCRKDASSKSVEVPDPNAEETFLQSKLDWDSAGNGEHSEWSRFYRELLQLRREHIMSRVDDNLDSSARFSMLSERGLRASWTLKDGLELILLANFAADSLQHSTEIGGDLLYSSSASTPDQLARTLPPWSASWFLAR